MTAVMTCKLRVNEVIRDYSQKAEGGFFAKIRMGAVWEGTTEAQQQSENAVFGKWTPMASFDACIGNPNVTEKLEVGQEYIVTFTLAESSPVK